MGTYFDETFQGAHIVINSEGWSGEVVHRRPYGAPIQYFKFDIEHHVHVNNNPYDGSLITADDNRGFAPAGNDAIIGISLEHFGQYNDGSENIFQCLGFKTNSGHYGDVMPVFGGDDTELNIAYDDIEISHYFVTSTLDGEEVEEIIPHNLELRTSNNIGVTYIRVEYVPGNYSTVINTDLPIFATDADLLEYCQSGGTITNKILNTPDPEEEYTEQFKYHYIKNIYGHNTRNASSYTGFRNYRIFPASKRVCFYRVKPTTSNPYTLRLKGFDGCTIKSAPVYADPHGDDDAYNTISGDPELYYLHKSISFSENNYYSKFEFQSDLPIYGSESSADDYLNNLIDERSAENWNDISRAYSETFDPNYGDPDTGNDNGVNGQSYVKGARLWVMESTDLNNFFDDIFNDVNISDILSGCQLFGQSAISCIMGVMYLPVDVDDVATVYSTKQTIKLGSWACPTAKGRYVQNNNKIIDCGSFFVARVYNDFRDYEMKLSLDLPYIGTIETSIGRFLGKTLSIKYAVDITTGGCTAHIYSDNLEMESYDGFMASVRPIQALDQISHLNAVMGIVGSIGGRETGMINTATESFAGVATGNIGGSSKGGFNAPSSGVGLGGALDLSAGAISDLYSLGQAVKDKPIAVRGSYAGCLGLFGCQKIHIRVQQPRIYRAPNLQQIAGFPSGVGQRVGMFSGFLSVISFQMVDGFTGTADELEEIYGILKQGIYI